MNQELSRAEEVISERLEKIGASLVKKLLYGG